MRHRIAGVTLVAVCGLVIATYGQQRCNGCNFAPSEQFLQSLRAGHTILPTCKMDVDGHSALKSVGHCEALRGARTPEGIVDPDAVVAKATRPQGESCLEASRSVPSKTAYLPRD